MNAGRELDALIATKVMGWTDVDDGLGTFDGRCYVEVPEYSTDIGKAWLVADEVFTNDWILYKFYNDYYVYESSLDFEDGNKLASAETAPLAICLAALRALES